MTFHRNFPYGIGFWVWEIESLLSQYGSLDAIAQKCKDNNVSYVLVKCADGLKTWQQFTPQMLEAFHSRGIKVLAWSYMRGTDFMREAAICIWALNLGADGYVFDAEGEFERPGMGLYAENMLKLIRGEKPDAFLAHAPYPIISYHTGYPYDVFGKYCDAVMPQVYWGTIYKAGQPDKVRSMINWMFQEWSAWEKRMIDSGKSDSVKPIIPAGQGYDNDQTGFVMTPADITEFLTICKGYKSLNFWDMQHFRREDLWNAVKNFDFTFTQVQPPAPVQPEVIPVPTIPVIPIEVPTVPEAPIVPEVPTEPTLSPVSPQEPEQPPQIEPAPEESPVQTVEEPVTETPLCPPTIIRIEAPKHIDYIILFFKWIIKILNIKIT